MAGLAGLEKGRGGCVGGLNGSAFRALVMEYHSCWWRGLIGKDRLSRSCITANMG